ncbi:UNVERIFIED_CONTAM: hypothetical protein FKN15_024583 [Acipenser sinensis]
MQPPKSYSVGGQSSSRAHGQTTGVAGARIWGAKGAKLPQQSILIFVQLQLPPQLSVPALLLPLLPNLKRLNLCSRVFTDDEIQQWMKCDEADPAYHLLDDEEIVDDVNGNNSDKRESEDKDNETKAAVSHSEAMECFQKGLDWLEQQPEAETTQLLLVRSLIAMAAKKRSFRQTRIQDFFAPTQ